MASIRQARLHATNGIIEFLTLLFNEQNRTSWMVPFLMNNIVVFCALIYATVELLGSTVSLIFNESVGDDLYFEVKFEWHKSMYSLLSLQVCYLN